MKKQFSRLFLLCIISAAIYSCSKSDSTTTPTDNGNNGMTVGETVSLANAYTKGNLTLTANKTFYVSNLVQGTGGNKTTKTVDPTSKDTIVTIDSLTFQSVNKAIYYSMSKFKADSSDYEIQFTSAYGLKVDTSLYKMTFINKTFDNVTDTTGGTNIPAGLATSNNQIGVSTDSVPTSSGWYIYNIATHIVTAYQTRTYIITNKSTGDYYKFHIVSLYSNATPNATVAASNFPVYNFQYMKMN